MSSYTCQITGPAAVMCISQLPNHRPIKAHFPLNSHTAGTGDSLAVREIHHSQWVYLSSNSRPLQLTPCQVFTRPIWVIRCPTFWNSIGVARMPSHSPLSSFGVWRSWESSSKPPIEPISPLSLVGTLAQSAYDYLISVSSSAAWRNCSLALLALSHCLVDVSVNSRWLYDCGRAEIEPAWRRHRMEGGSVSRLTCSGTVHFLLLQFLAEQ